MSDPTGPGSEPGEGPATGPGDQEPVGSVGEEAAKLLGALSEWARDQGTEQEWAQVGTAAGPAGAFANAVREVGEHLSTGSAECRYCPVCQVIHVVRQTSPEVRAHLGVAASSLIRAAGELLATRTGSPEPATPPVEKIDLDGDDTWDEPEPPGRQP